MDLLRRFSSSNNVTADGTTAPANVDGAALEKVVEQSQPTPADGVTTTEQAPPAALESDTKLTSAEIEEKWAKTIAEAKAKTSIMTRLKSFRTSSKKKEKEKEKEAPLEEVDIAAMIPLPADSPAPGPAPSTTPGSNTLSRRIQGLLSSVPPFLHTLPDTASGDPTKLPVPPMADSKLLNYLSSPDIMNGNGTGSGTSTPTPKPKKSVWQVLDRLVPYKPPQASNDNSAEEDVEEEAAETSLMVYAPLFPDATSKVEVAKSQIIEVDTQEEIQKLPKEVAKEVASALWADKLKWWKKKKPGKETDSPDSSTNPTPTPAPAPAPKPKNPVKIWIPSTTEISFQVAWWGYRLWLPPPIMLILDDKTVEASKRAAMITTAIGWLINNIPTAVLPPPLKTAVTLLKGIVPILGYVGGFIAWSWGEIKSFDKGSGVVLSATWLLPIALIPSSWEDQETKLPIGRGSEEDLPQPAPTKPGPATGGGGDSTTTPTPGGSQPSTGTGGAAADTPPVSMPQPQPSPAPSSFFYKT